MTKAIADFKHIKFTKESKLSELISSDKNYIHAATSNNTRKAYQSDIRHFIQWGGKLPCAADEVIRYLHAFAETLNVRTLSRRITALKNWGSVKTESHY